MKKSAALLFITALIVFLNSCSKGTLDQPGFPGLRCNPGNFEYVADTAFYVRNLGTTIHGQTAGQDHIVIYLQHTDTTGTIALDTVNNTAYYENGSKTYASVSGSVVITQYYNDSLHMMSGNFGFTGRARDGTTVNVSYGYFNNIPRH